MSGLHSQQLQRFGVSVRVGVRSGENAWRLVLYAPGSQLRELFTPSDGEKTLSVNVARLTMPRLLLALFSFDKDMAHLAGVGSVNLEEVKSAESHQFSVPIMASFDPSSHTQAAQVDLTLRMQPSNWPSPTGDDTRIVQAETEAIRRAYSDLRSQNQSRVDGLAMQFTTAVRLPIPPNQAMPVPVWWIFWAIARGAAADVRGHSQREHLAYLEHFAGWGRFRSHSDQVADHLCAAIAALPHQITFRLDGYRGEAFDQWMYPLACPYRIGQVADDCEGFAMTGLMQALLFKKASVADASAALRPQCELIQQYAICPAICSLAFNQPDTELTYHVTLLLVDKRWLARWGVGGAFEGGRAYLPPLVVECSTPIAPTASKTTDHRDILRHYNNRPVVEASCQLQMPWEVAEDQRVYRHFLTLMLPEYVERGFGECMLLDREGALGVPLRSLYDAEVRVPVRVGPQSIQTAERWLSCLPPATPLLDRIAPSPPPPAPDPGAPGQYVYYIPTSFADDVAGRVRAAEREAADRGYHLVGIPQTFQFLRYRYVPDPESSAELVTRLVFGPKH